MGKIAVLFLGIVMGFSSLHCTRAGRNEKVFNTYTKERITGLDPALATDTYSQQALMQVYEGLLHFQYLKRPIELEPQLAEGLPLISPDGRTYTFKIRHGVHFQNSEVFKNGTGRELTARDFIYSFKRLADPHLKSENYWVFRDKIQGLEKWREEMASGKASYDTPVEGFSAPDDFTLVLRLTKPNFQLTALLASAMTVAVPREAVEHFGPEFSGHAVGTGAFQFDSWTRGSRLILVKNPTYREAHHPAGGALLPLVDRVVISEIVEEQPQWLEFQKGDLDMLYVPKDYLEQTVVNGELPEAFKKKGFHLDLVPSTDIVYISFNTENPFLKNKKLRQAMSMAYDKTAMIKTFYSGMGIAAHGPIPPTIAGYRQNAENPNVKFDLDKAKQRLREAGFPGGRGLPEFTFELGSGHSTARQMAEFFKNHMALIGIKIKLNINTWAQFSEKIKKKQAAIFDMSWNADYPDAENFLQMFYSGNISPGPNNSNFKNADYDALYEKFLKLPPGGDKDALTARMEDLLMDQTPWIFSLHRMRVVLSQSWLKNYKPEYMILDAMKYYDIDKNEKARLKPTF